MTESNIHFKCKYCNKAYKIVKVDKKIGTILNLKILFDSNCPVETNKTLINLKNEKYNINKGFGTYTR
ncbi:MAG: hypothetical protein ACOC3Z_00560 [Nanoarchaeota archaeon]